MAQDAVNPNALGAPAEGFGQTVSFAFDPRGEVPQQRPVTSRGPQVGVSGVSGAQLSELPRPQPVVQDPTAALLMKAGSAILDKRVEEARTEQFVQGMQRSMAGEGIKEVQESVPWYAKLFGDTPVIEGARAYEAQDRVNKTIAEQTAKMPALASLGTDAAGKHFTGVMKSALTGDAGTDQIIMKQMAESMPALMKAQAKANYGYNQKRAVQAMSTSIASGAAAFQQFGEQHAADEVNSPDMEALGKQFVMSVLPPAGIDEENYQKTVTSAMLGMAEKGQFHAIEALRKSGVTAALTPEQGNRIDKTVESAATRARDRYAFKFADVLAEIKSDSAHPATGQTPRQLAERIDRANASFQKLTGSPVGLFSSDQKADLIAGNFNALKGQEEKAANAAHVLADKNATAAAKAAAAEQTAQLVRTSVVQGDANLAKKLPGVTSDDVDLEVYKLYQSDKQGSVQFLRQNWAKGYVSTLIADEVQQPLKLASASFAQNPTSPPPDSFFSSVNLYRTMSQEAGTPFANAYFGEHAKAMAYASHMLKDNVLDNPGAPDIYQQAMRAKDFRGEKMSEKDRTALVKKVTSEGKSFLNKATLGFAGHALREDATRFIAEDVEEAAGQWEAAGLSKEEATAFAINDIMGANGKGGARGEVIGGYYIRRDPAASADPVTSIMEGGKNGSKYTAIPDDIKSNIFEDFLGTQLKLPPNLGTTKLHRMPDAGGTERFVLTAFNPETKLTEMRTFSGLELQTYAADKTKWKRLGAPGTRGTTAEEDAAFSADDARRRATPYTSITSHYDPDLRGMSAFMGTPVLPGQGASPYATAAQRAAFRAKQQPK